MSNFVRPPAHLCAVRFMTEISLIVMLNNQFSSHIRETALLSRLSRHAGHTGTYSNVKPPRSTGKKIMGLKESHKYLKMLGTEPRLGEEKKSPLVITHLVKTEMDKRGLVFSSKRNRCSLEGLIMELSYISCIGFVMNGWYGM